MSAGRAVLVLSFPIGWVTVRQEIVIPEEQLDIVCAKWKIAELRVFFPAEKVPTGSA